MRVSESSSESIHTVLLDKDNQDLRFAFLTRFLNLFTEALYSDQFPSRLASLNNLRHALQMSSNAFVSTLVAFSISGLHTDIIEFPINTSSNLEQHSSSGTCEPIQDRNPSSPPSILPEKVELLSNEQNENTLFTNNNLRRFQRIRKKPASTTGQNTKLIFVSRLHTVNMHLKKNRNSVQLSDVTHWSMRVET
ncbi:hypothetical protein FF38_01858 [Lucilia cuprina]|uniref:Uncharacterized protein n=1 Tax=Lucilia cuprina TaxID=7375 RepID=A0A0L0BSH9_LUCCU|nr:hypothetical protein FF38_01858 [Lucilia cuprina]